MLAILEDPMAQGKLLVCLSPQGGHRARIKPKNAPRPSNREPLGQPLALVSKAPPEIK